MSFASPWLLTGLLLLPVLVTLYVRAERRASSRRAELVAPALMPAVAPKRPRWRRHVPVALQALALSGLIVALARPQVTAAVAVEQATVIIATDRSGSMQARDVAPTRLQAARRAADGFVEAVPDDVRVGAIAFNHRPSVIQAPTRDHQVLQAALGRVRAAGSTATGDALVAALGLIEATKSPTATRRPPAAVVLLSDGKSVRGRDALEVAEDARTARVPVYTVALGTAQGTIESLSPSGAIVREAVPPDPSTLRRIAERTGGGRSPSPTRRRSERCMSASAPTWRRRLGARSARAGSPAERYC
jgi:Ca-activated chloride channel family protein